MKPFAAAVDRAAAAPEEPVRVLVVDDVEANRVALAALLRAPGVDVICAAGGTQALELLLGHDIALALLDVQMPGMDGYALASMMRGSERTRAVPIIFVTAGAQEARAAFRGYDSGAVDFLFKPVDEQVLRSKVAVFVALARQRRQLAEHAAQLERLAHANALMLAALSNDIREPLAALALGSTLLAERGTSAPLRDAALRQKRATALLRRQVEHLINLAKAPSLDIRPRGAAVDLGALAQRCWRRQAEPGGEAEGACHTSGDTVGLWDPELLAGAVDQLLLQAQTHGGSPLALSVDGSARHSVVLRVETPDALSAGAARHLLGQGGTGDVLPPPVGPGLREVERVARAHGGSLLGRSSAAEGTSFELLLPRGRAEIAR